MKQTAVTLLSGGLDSAVATAMAARNVGICLALTFDYGQRARQCEIDVARQLSDCFGCEHRVIELPWLRTCTRTSLVNTEASLVSVPLASIDEGADERARSVWVPNRNGTFLAIAASIAESLDAGIIIAGFNTEEAQTFPDNSAAFLEATNAALAYSTLNQVRLASPTIHLYKAQIAAQFIELDLDPALFWCCYEGNVKLCGRCESCARTIRAFQETGQWNRIASRFEKADT